MVIKLDRCLAELHYHVHYIRVCFSAHLIKMQFNNFVIRSCKK